MIYEHIKLQNGATAIVCYGRGRRHRCGCGAIATLLCDFPKKNGKTCDKHLCRRCAVKVGHDRDFCRDHPAEQLSMELAP